MDNSAPKITPVDTGDHPGQPDPRVPRRADLAGPGVEVLKQGGRTKADLLVVDVGQGPLVVKDFHDKPGWVRLVGRWQISRECRAYRRLAPAPWLPRLVGRIDVHALALTRIDGRQLYQVPERRERGSELMARLREAVEAMHEQGMVHLDLRGRENVMLGDDDRLYVLDLASAIWFRPGGAAHRLLFPLLQRTDHAALLKWKEILGAGPFTEDERRFLRRHRFWRSFWIFNRKRRTKERRTAE